jgi:hypothetical protein
MGAALLAQLDDPVQRARLAERFAEIHEQLRCNCAVRAAQALIDMVPPARLQAAQRSKLAVSADNPQALS